MDLVNSQESEIINEGDFNYIISDLGPSQQLMFLHGNEYADDNIYNSTNTQQQLGGGAHHLLINAALQSADVVGGGGGGAHMLPPPTPAPHSSPTGLQPCLTKYPGVFDFQVELASTHSGRHAWVYSHKLQKIFIDKDKVLLFHFKLNTVDVKGLCVRALLVYTDPDNAMLAVNRCTLHEFKCDPLHQAHATERVCLCERFNLCRHVVTSEHPHAQYEYNADSGRHSVVVPLAADGGYAAGQDATTVAYLFGCKTSCAAGMSRRPVRLVFTLETQFGEVMGRSTVLVKICSCPKRDKDREESGDFTLAQDNGPNHGNNISLPHSSSSTKQLLNKKRKLHETVSTQTPARDTIQSSPELIAMLLEEVRELNAKVDHLLNNRVVGCCHHNGNDGYPNN